MMQLVNVTVIRNLVAQTENANYQIEYHVDANELGKVSVAISTPTGNESIGNIDYEGGCLTSSFFSTLQVIPHFEDFSKLMEEIKAEVEKQKQLKQG